MKELQIGSSLKASLIDTWPRTEPASEPRDRRKRVVRLLPHLQLTALWLILIGRCFHFTEFVNNEVDVLPVARQAVESDWLPGDWYLNLEIGYRGLFNAMAGPLVSHLGFVDGAIVGRLLVYLLMAGAILAFFRALKIPFGPGILMLLVFLNKQTIVAGEWMVGGLETKAVAWPLVILALAALARRTWFRFFAFSGAAMSFHILLGSYALICSAVALIADRNARREWRSILGKSWIVFVTGGWGLHVIGTQLFDSGPAPEGGWTDYVLMRVPHHVHPTAWNGSGWMIEVAVALAILVVLRRSRNEAISCLARYGITALALFGFGLVLWLAGAVALLRFYWFRFGDTIVPFIVTMLIAYGAGLMDRGLAKSQSGLLIKRTVPLLATVVVVTISAIQTMSQATSIPRWSGARMRWPSGRGSDQMDDRPRASILPGALLDRIKRETPTDALFLISPTMQEFYVRAERRAFVSFKHSPQSAADVTEWRRRLRLLNGGRPITERGFAVAKEIERTFYNMSADEVQHLAHVAGADYYLGKTEQQLPFRAVMGENGYVLYAVGE